jgi:hypothetical protein
MNQGETDPLPRFPMPGSTDVNVRRSKEKKVIKKKIFFLKAYKLLG